MINKDFCPLQNSISYLQYSSKLSTLLHSPTSHHPTPGSTRSSSYLSLSHPPVPSSLKFCNRSFAYAASALWNGLSKDLRQFVRPPNPRLNFTYPPLALSSATFHSRLKTELFKLSYPDATPAPPHVRHHHRLQP